MPRARREDERKLRRSAVTAATGRPAEPDDETDEESARDRRADQQALWVDLQVRQAIRRGEFDDLPGAGKPIRGLTDTHDPNWWVKSLIEREQITGVLPPALALRREDAELDARLDREGTEQGVRAAVEEFNQRVVEARRQLLGGPPVVTPTRDADAAVLAWRQRRAERRERQRRLLAESAQQSGSPPRWWQRRRGDGR